MKKQLFVMTILCATLFAGSFCTAQKKSTADTQSSSPTEQSEPPFITAIKEKIKGKEKLPAEEVFENIQSLKGVPAGRVLPIMKMAYSKSLGVKCSHCHDINNWASDEKKAKQITRDMSEMMSKLNREILTEIKYLQSERPAVNCTTCHRGEIKPALNM